MAWKNNFLDIYLQRRRELEVDRMAKEQFDRQMALREQEAEQQHQYQRAVLNEQIAQREQAAKQWSEQFQAGQASLKEQQQLELGKLFAEGVAREPGQVPIPFAPGAQPKVLQDLTSGTVPEAADITYAGKNLKFTTPAERYIAQAEAQEKAATAAEERRRQRLFGFIDNAVSSGDMPEMMGQAMKNNLLLGQSPAKQDAESTFMWAQSLLSNPNLPDAKRREYVRIAAQAKDWLDAVRTPAIPWGSLFQRQADTKAGQYIRTAMERFGLQNTPAEQLTSEQLRQVRDAAAAMAAAGGTPDDAKAIDTILGFGEKTTQADPMDEFIRRLLAPIMEKMNNTLPQPGRGQVGRGMAGNP